MSLLNHTNWDHAKSERNEHWKRVRAARLDYRGDIGDFYKFLNEQYGVKLNLDEVGQILGEFEIVDEHKYFLFVLKYGYGN